MTLTMSSSMQIFFFKFFRKFKWNLILDISNIVFHLKKYIELDFEDIEFYIELDSIKIKFKKQGIFSK